LADHAQLGFDGQRIVWHLQAKSGDAARVGHAQTQAHANGGGFARAIGTNHAQTLAGLDTKGQAIDHGGVAVAFA